jgi:hypothetical protein
MDQGSERQAPLLGQFISRVVFLFLLINVPLRRPSASFRQPDFDSNRLDLFQDLIKMNVPD